MAEFKLPLPDTHCFDDDTQKDVWSYSTDLVQEILRAALDQPVQQPAVPSGYRIERVTDGDIRIYSPDGSSWLATSGEDGFYGFIHQFLNDLLNAAPEATAAQNDRDAQEAPFEQWWEKHGQFCRAGGGEYEKTFAWNAWCAAEQKEQP